MTTIAYRNGVIAADTRATRGEVLLPGHSRKIRRLDDGSVIAIKGDLCMMEPFLSWLQSNRQGSMPDLDKSGTGLIHLTKGGVFVYEGAGWYQEDLPFFAMGSGCVPAMTAMYMGANAAKAVRVAMDVDPYTGGRIDWMTLDGEGQEDPAIPETFN